MNIERTENAVWFSLDFCPNADLVVVVRHFVDDFCNQILEVDYRGLLAVAIHELLENGVKHSADGRVSVRVEVEKTDAAVAVKIWTRNAASSADREAVSALFTLRREAEDADAFYQEMMLKPGPGGLGLARIMAETGMDLKLELDSEGIAITGAVEFPIGGARNGT